MNLTNLKRMYNHILLNVSEKNLGMRYFRYGDEFSHECKSVGCVIGHCTILDKWKNIPKSNRKINFTKWSEDFTDLISYSEKWDWCFSGRWSNDKDQILLRIKYLIDNQEVPEDFNDFDYILPTQKLELYELD